MTHTVVPRVQTHQLKCRDDSFKTGCEIDRSMFITDADMLKSSDNQELWSRMLRDIQVITADMAGRL